MSEPTSGDSASGKSAISTNPEPVKPSVNWHDPAVPVGNAPALSRFPLLASAVVFALWIVFLIAMAVIRLKTVSD